jgi:hypothetical protein
MTTDPNYTPATEADIFDDMDLFDYDTCMRCGIMKPMPHQYGPAGEICRDCTGHLTAIDLLRSHGLLHDQDDMLWYSTWEMDMLAQGPLTDADYDTRHKEGY